MRIVKCDFCGAEMSQDKDVVQTLLGELDLCPACTEWLGSVDLRALVLKAVCAARSKSAGKRSAEPPRQAPEPEQKPKPTPEPEPKPEPQAVTAVSGPYSTIKRNVLAALNEYREKHGTGCWTELARKAKVHMTDIYDMRDCKSVSIEKWRAVGAALGVQAEAGREKSEGEGKP